MRIFRCILSAVVILPLYLFSQENSNNYSAGLSFLYYTGFEKLQYEPFVRVDIEEANALYGFEYYCSFNREIETESEAPRHTTIHNFTIDSVLYSKSLFFEGEIDYAAGRYRYNEVRAKVAPGISYANMYSKLGLSSSICSFVLERDYTRYSISASPETGYRKNSLLLALSSPISFADDEGGKYRSISPSLRYRNTIKPLFFYSTSLTGAFSEKDGAEARANLTLGLSGKYGDISVAYTFSKAFASRWDKAPDHLIITGISASL